MVKATGPPDTLVSSRCTRTLFQSRGRHRRRSIRSRKTRHFSAVDAGRPAVPLARSVGVDLLPAVVDQRVVQRDANRSSIERADDARIAGELRPIALEFLGE